MKVWLTRKHAERIDGVDLRRYHVGDTLTLPRTDAQLLIAEQWALPERRRKPTGTRYRRRATDA